MKRNDSGCGARDLDGHPLLSHDSSTTLEAVHETVAEKDLDDRRLGKNPCKTVGQLHDPALEGQGKIDSGVVCGPVGGDLVLDLINGQKPRDVRRIPWAEIQLEGLRRGAAGKSCEDQGKREAEQGNCVTRAGSREKPLQEGRAAAVLITLFPESAQGDISRRMAVTAALGSAAAMMGRPTTR